MKPRELAGLSTPEARLVALPAGLVALGLVGPRRLSRLPSPCLVRRALGVCPACGVTRAMAALLRADLRPRPRLGLGALVLTTLGAVVVRDLRRILPCAARIRVSKVIDAPPARVWEDVRDISSHVHWMEDARRIRFTSAQREGVGTAFEVDTRVGPFRLDELMEVVEWEKGRSMGVRHGGVVTGTGRFVVDEQGPGRTRFTWDEELQIPWWMGGPLGSVVAGRVLGRVWARNLANLKARVEAR